MTATMTRTARALAVLDIEVGGYTPEVGEADVRTPDFVEDEHYFWIGADAIVMVPIGTDLLSLVDVLERAGHMARAGQRASDSNIFVLPHSETVVRGPLQRNGHLFTLWHMARQTVLSHQEA